MWAMNVAVNQNLFSTPTRNATPVASTSLIAAKTAGRALDEVARLEALLRECEDLSALSPELLERAIKAGCWYHVTPFRAALIRTLEIPSGARILEVGCGGGALTRYLGERGFHVTALETSEELAECARLRCRDLANVEVVTGYLEQVLAEQKYDFVICVDPNFVESEFLDPGVQLLTLCRKVLKATGSLILSLANPLHSPKAHVEPSRDHVRGKGTTLEALKLSLSSAGFLHYESYITFPHHAAPQLLVDAYEARAERVSWLDLIKDLYASTDIAQTELEQWWKGVFHEGLESTLAPGWLVLAHSHHVHSVLWSGEAVKQVAIDTEDSSGAPQQPARGVGIYSLGAANNDVLSTILKASKPAVNSVRDYKESLVSADRKIEDLSFKESAARAKLQDAHDALVRAEDRHTTELYQEQESRRVREAELGLVLKQYHAVGAMCHDMREEGRKLKDMLEELRRRYVASEDWGSALAKRVVEAETELLETRASRGFRLAQKIKSFFKRTPSRLVALEKGKKATAA